MTVIIPKTIKIIIRKNKLINLWNKKISKKIFKQNFLCFMKNLKAILYNNRKSLIF